MDSEVVPVEAVGEQLTIPGLMEQIEEDVMNVRRSLFPVSDASKGVEIVEPRAKWRVGRTVGRTVYVQRFDDPSKADALIGVMDTQGLAELVCRCVNYCSEHGIDPGTLGGGVGVAPHDVPMTEAEKNKQREAIKARMDRR